MQEKEILVTTWASVNGPWVIAGMVAFVMALLRTFWINSGLEPKDVAEALMCAIFIAVSRPLWVLVPWVSDAMALPIGCIAGVLGARVLIPMAERLAGVFGSRKA